MAPQGPTDPDAVTLLGVGLRAGVLHLVHCKSWRDLPECLVARHADVEAQSHRRIPFVSTPRAPTARVCAEPRA